MLEIFDNREDILDRCIPLIDSNDEFFDSGVELADDALTREILQKIEKARYGDSLSFYGRADDGKLLNKDLLSTGTKTLLNIKENPKLCFNVCECGDNALCLLPLLKEGLIFWEYPSVMLVSGNSYMCDILFNNKLPFHNLLDFMNYVRYEYGEEA